MGSSSQLLTILLCSSWIISGCSTQKVKPKYKGCYEVRETSSLLSGLKETNLTALTPEVCSKFCTDKKFTFAGVQKRECRCGNHVPSDILKRSNDECNQACPGQKSTKCGGKDVISVYETEVKIVNFITTRFYLGCYKDDNAQFRVLKGSWNEFADNSPQKCHEHCFKSGFKLFGLTYQKECFCGDTPPLEETVLSEDECDSRCSGNSNEICGGGWRLSIYATGITDFPEVGRIVGCIKNLRNTEVKTEYKISLPKSNSNRRCLNMCNLFGYKYSGTQNRTECICTNVLPNMAFIDNEKNCDKEECPGDLTDKCGNAKRVKIYRTRLTDPPAADSFNLGCYEDRLDFRVLSGPKVTIDESLTPLLCVNICREKGYAFAGLEAGNECFCGHAYPSQNVRADENDCTIPCIGNENDLCGGLLRMSIYDTGLPHNLGRVGFSYKGCYRDDNKDNRLLKGSWQQLENNSPDVCHRLCLKTGFTAFGLTYTKECFCGDENPSEEFLVSDSECSSPCGGDSNRKCGGGWRLSVYKTGLLDVASTTNPEYLGCFQNDASLISEYRIELSAANKPKRCINICDQLGFLYAGVQRGYDCRCGTKQPPILAGDEAKCNVKCPGDGSEMCGANDYVGVYRTTVVDTGNKDISAVVDTNSKTGSCKQTPSTKNEKPLCKNDLIFNENFDSLNSSVWKHTVKMASDPDYEFVTYSASKDVVYVKNGILYIKPALQTEAYVRGNKTLADCTGKPTSDECTRSASFNYILPPVLSGQISTVRSFSFRYGRLDIRAKVPLGDWIIPQIWLTPKDSIYGAKYESGQIRIAMARGNSDFKCGESKRGNQVMENGIHVGPPNSVQTIVFINETTEEWSKKFHNYSLVWTTDNLAFFVDGKLISHVLKSTSSSDTVIKTAKLPSNSWYIWEDGSKLAPFDKEFYVTLGVSVGGVKDFPDTCLSAGNKKPWTNTGVKAMYNFWSKRSEWQPTWIGDNVALQVDHIKAGAI